MAVFDIGDAPFLAGDGEHWFRKVDGNNRLEMAGEFVSEKAGSATDVEDTAAMLWKMFEKKRMIALQ